jgi:hypothetical protein
MSFVYSFVRDNAVLFVKFLQSSGIRYLDFTPPAPTYMKLNQLPTVPNVPWAERLDFWSHRGPNYARRIFMSQFVALQKGLFDYQAKPIPDEEMAHVFNHSGFSKYLKKVDHVDWMPAGRQKPPKDSSYWLADFSFMCRIKPNKGFFNAGTKVCFEIQAYDPDHTPHPVGIWLDPKTSAGPQVFLPSNKGWDSAKLFVMQGASHYSAFIEHPKIHFPFDTINAMTKHLPEGHIMRQLLSPHQRFTLTLNDTVLNNQFISILLNPWMPQCPFEDPANEIQWYLEECKAEWAWCTTPYPTENPSAYAKFTGRYFETFKNFVQGVVAARPLEFRDEHVRNWADNVAPHLKGFPNGEAIVRGDVIVQVLTKIMWNLTVEHGADHYSYFIMPNWNWAPWRVRVPPPQHPQDAVDFSKVNKHIDMWKFAQAQEVFFYSTSQYTLGDIDYKFKDGNLQELNTKFRHALKRVDEVKEDRLMSLAQIGQSIDY